MILVLTGFHPEPFNRLISAMDEIAAGIGEEVVIQSGESKIGIKHARHIRYVGFKDIEELIRSARIVIAHAGVGTILDCRRLDKQLIVIPRRKEFGESYDDHQLEITESISDSKSTIVLEDVSQLRKIIDTMQSTSASESDAAKSRIIGALRLAIKDISEMS